MAYLEPFLCVLPIQAIQEGWSGCVVLSHDVHRGTVRTLLYAGGFVQRNGRWFAAPQNEVGTRKLRAALVETLVPEEHLEQVSKLEFEQQGNPIISVDCKQKELLGQFKNNGVEWQAKGEATEVEVGLTSWPKCA